jgi:histidinol dehydrogenase
MNGDGTPIRLRRLNAEELLAEAEAEDDGVDAAVKAIVADVRKRGDAALFDYARKFDGCELVSVKAPFPRGKAALDEAAASGGEALLAALRSSADRIRRFARAQLKSFRNFRFEIARGVRLGQRVDALDSVGVYVPGGRYPLVSSALMCVIPAKVAGVKRVAVMSPPMRDGKPHPLIVAAAEIAGADEFYVSGGAQGIAALAYGTETVRAADKVVGPGNAYVSGAKRLIAADVGIDFYAGPSEVLVVADDSADPALVAADLAAQAEHDPLARSILVSLSEGLAHRVEEELDRRLASLSTERIARASLDSRGAFVIAGSLEDAARIASAYAPEHLELHLRGARRAASLFRNYGSVFIGGCAAEVLGDYSAGVNHTLPTRRAARYVSGLSVKDFLCLRTSVEAKAGKALDAMARDAAEIAKAEGLSAHEAAARERISKGR